MAAEWAMRLCVQAKRSAEAPLNACARLLRRQAQGPHGGFGGRRLQRHLTYSRFRSALLGRGPVVSIVQSNGRCHLEASHTGSKQ